jgi:hypothetical protein
MFEIPEEEAQLLLQLCDNHIAMDLIKGSVKYRAAVIHRLTMYDFQSLEDVMQFTGSLTAKRQQLLTLVERFPILGSDEREELLGRIRVYAERERARGFGGTARRRRALAQPSRQPSRSPSAQQSRHGSAHPSRQTSAVPSRPPSPPHEEEEERMNIEN